jgi:plasmid stabilization system protein ParE
LSQLKQACDYIKKDSPKNSLKVRKDVFSACMALATYPAKCAMDKYKHDNDGSYRAFELHNYRITYRVLKTEIRILRIRHTSMEPLEY